MSDDTPEPDDSSDHRRPRETDGQFGASPDSASMDAPDGRGDDASESGANSDSGTGSGQETDAESEGAVREDRESELRMELEILREENERLRDEYARTQQVTYRRTALALAGIGAGAVALGTVLPRVQEVLFVTGFIGLFGAVLTWFLTPEQVLTVGVAESIYAAAAANAVGIRDELGLRPTTIYVPGDDEPRVFIPQHRAFELPDDPSAVFVAENDASRGVSLTPTGAGLVEQFERTRKAPTPSTLEDAAVQVGDAVVEQFEIAEGVVVDPEVADDEAAVSITGAAFGPVTRLDHPVVSVIGCGTARALDDPVSIEPVDDTTVTIERLIGEEGDPAATDAV